MRQMVFHRILLVGCLGWAISCGSEADNSSPPLEIRLPAPPRLAAVEGMTAKVEISDVGTFDLTVTADGSASGEIRDVPVGSRTMTIRYFKSEIVLAEISRSLDLAMGQRVDVKIVPAEFKYPDSDGNGTSNLDEILAQTGDSTVIASPGTSGGTEISTTNPSSTTSTTFDQAENYKIIAQFEPPGGSGSGALDGIVWDGTGLWTYSRGTLYVIDRETGATLKSRSASGLPRAWNGSEYLEVDGDDNITLLDASFFPKTQFGKPTDFKRGRPVAITWDGSIIVYIAVPETGCPLVVEFDSARRVEGNSFQIPGCTDAVPLSFRSGSYPSGGLAWDGQAFWISGYAEGSKVYRVSKTGAVLKSFTSPAKKTSDIEWDGRFLWIADSSSGRILKMLVPTE